MKKVWMLFVALYRVSLELSYNAFCRCKMWDYDELPAFNYFQIKKGKHYFIFKDEKDRKLPIKAIKRLSDLDFELELIDTEVVYKLTRIAYYKGKFALTKDKKYKMRANEIEKELKKGSKPFDENQFIFFIESALGNQKGSLDLRKITIKRLFNLYQNALKEARRNGNN